MRKLIALAVTSMALSSVHAATPVSFGDLNYFLKAGQFNVSVDANSTFDEYDTTGRQETRGYLFETRYGYGITEAFNVYLGLDYAYDRQTEDKGTATNGDIYNDGLANPLLAANYRLLNQKNAAVFLDFGAVARINIMDAEVGSTAGQNVKDGNFADGRSSLELNARMGQKWNEANEWQFTGGVVYHKSGETTLRGQTGDSDIDLDSSLDLFLKAAYQYRPVNEFMMTVSLQGTRVGEADAKNKDSNTNLDADSHIDWDFGFNAKYLLTDAFILKFNFGMSRLPDYDLGNSEIAKRHANFYGLGADFLF